MSDAGIDDVDREIIRATQSGLPLAPRPYHIVADQLGIGDDEVMKRMKRMCEIGIIRRIGVVPNHYALGIKSNGMSVWDVDDNEVERLGQEVGALHFVSHCYLRPRIESVWSYNLFAMVHGVSRAEVEEKVCKIAALLNDACRGHEVLYSIRILKKTGLRLAA